MKNHICSVGNADSIFCEKIINSGESLNFINNDYRNFARKKKIEREREKKICYFFRQVWLKKLCCKLIVCDVAVPDDLWHITLTTVRFSKKLGAFSQSTAHLNLVKPLET